MTDLYGGFLTNLQVRKKRKPRYDSIGLPIMPPEPKPRLDAIGLPKRETRAELLHRRQQIMNSLGYGLQKSNWESYMRDRNEREQRTEYKQVRNIYRLQELEYKRKRKEELTGEEWRNYVTWSTIDTDTLSTLAGIKSISLLDIKRADDMPDRLLSFIENEEGTSRFLFGLITGYVDGHGEIYHATLFIRRDITDRDGNRIISIEHYDPSGNKLYNARNLLRPISLIQKHAMLEYTYKREEEGENIYFHYEPPTEKSYQDVDTSVACSRMCFLRMIEYKKPISEFVKNFDDLPAYYADETTGKLLDKYGFHDIAYPLLEKVLLDRRSGLSAEDTQYTTAKINLKRYETAKTELPKIDEALSKLPAEPTEETPA
jgi:hypothetical protein